MIRIEVMFAPLLLAIAPAVFAHPGHPTLSPHHTHGALELNPLALLIVAAIAVGAIFLGRGTARPRAKSLRNKK